MKKFSKFLALGMSAAMLLSAACADEESTEYTGASGVTVWCVDIAGVMEAVSAADADYAAGYDALTSSSTAADKQALAEAAGISVSNVNIIVDGETYAENVDVYFGDIEGNGKLRIEIYNAYGTIKTGYEDLTAMDSIEVQFTIAGLPSGSYDAFLMYTDSAWGFGNWKSEAEEAGEGDIFSETDATISADGTYTVGITLRDPATVSTSDDTATSDDTTTDAADTTTDAADTTTDAPAATTDSSAQTGDATNVIALAGLAVVALGGVVVANKKRA